MKKQKIVYLEYLRVVSMVCVIIMHVSAGLLTNDIDMSWQGLNLLTSLSFIAVPVFFMISGAVVLGSEKTYSPLYLIKNRLPKLILPLCVWSMIAVLPSYLTSEATAQGFQWINYLKWFFVIPSNNIAVHLWFMYFLIPIYLLSPFLKSMVDHLKQDQVRYLFLLWGFIVCMSTINGFLPSSISTYTSIDMFNRINLLGGYLFYFLAGYYLHTMEVKIAHWKLILVCVVNSTIVIAGTSLLSLHNGVYTNTFQSVNYVFIALMSCSIFLLAKQTIHRSVVPKWITYFAASSFCIYLMHNIWISILKNYIWNYTDFIGGMGAVLITIIVCAGITSILASIKPLCYLFTGISYTKAKQNCNLHFLLTKQKNEGNESM